MHLLLAQKGTIAEGTEAIDLGQTPGDVLFLSAADTELASLASAQRHNASAISLRLANMMALSHPMSVDAYIERTARHAKLIVVRIIGGESYWPYGLEALHACAVNHKVQFAVLPGDDKPDPGLDRFSTMPRSDRDALWHYREGQAAGRGSAIESRIVVAG
jgi:cobaltochelatase CobN